MTDPQASSAELVAHYAALIHPFQGFLGELRREQERLQREMRDRDIEEVAGPGVAAQGAAGVAANAADPVGWLRDTPAVELGSGTALDAPGEAALVPDPADSHPPDPATTRAVIAGMELDPPDSFDVGDVDAPDTAAREPDPYF